jgi:hypothetical protein
MSSGDCGACFLLRDLRFGAIPVLEVATIFPAPLLVEFIGTTADLFLDAGRELGWFVADGTYGFSAIISAHGGYSFQLTMRAR